MNWLIDQIEDSFAKIIFAAKGLASFLVFFFILGSIAGFIYTMVWFAWRVIAWVGR
jgi:hypothetical protein